MKKIQMMDDIKKNVMQQLMVNLKDKFAVCFRRDIEIIERRLLEGDWDIIALSRLCFH